MAHVKTSSDIERIRELAVVVSDLLAWSISLVRPGLTTAELDRRIEDRMTELGVSGPCKGYHGYPAVSCLSVNDQITHGIPDARPLADGDIIDIDLVIERGGYFADMSRTVAVGPVPESTRRLVLVTEECLARGLREVKPGNTLGDVGWAIQSHAEKNGYTVVRDFTGHFIGKAMHEEPMVLNWGKKKKGLTLAPGMVFCIEPMVSAGQPDAVHRGWDARTRDGSLCSRCEHMVLVTADGHEVLTRFPDAAPC